VTATKHRLRLSDRRKQRVEREEYLDPKDEQRLRELLEELAEEASEGREVRLDEWKLEVFPGRRRRRIATVKVDASGRTEVKR
jgi:hypothetical protein